MEQWQDHGFVLSMRPHGENGAVVSFLTRNHGRHAGYIHGGTSSKKRGALQPGCLVDVDWRARMTENLGTISAEQVEGLPAGVMEDPLRLGALLSTCSLCDEALPEREGHAGLFHGFETLLHMMAEGGDLWAAAYIFWEVAFLRELGYGLDFSRCALTGERENLIYISPKTGRAACTQAGEPYREKLLPLPSFLSPTGEKNIEPIDILQGLELTGYFLEHWAFAHHTRGVPEARLRFGARYARFVAGLKIHEQANL